MPEITMPHKYRPRDYQLPLWQYMSSNRRYRRAVCIWHRRAGKDFTALNIMATQALQRVGNYWHVFPFLKQGREIAWQGKTKGGQAFLEAFPRELIEGEPHNGDMRLRLKNGSTYQVKGADHPDRLVGAGPVGVIFSEWPLMDPQAQRLINPMLNENDGWAMYLYTPRGKNHGYWLHQEAQRNRRWYHSLLTVEDTGGIVTPEMIDEDRRQGASEALIQQEYYCSFETPLEGAYFEKQCNILTETNRITEVPIEPDLPVHTGWDLGMDDQMVIWFAQVHGTSIRIPWVIIGSDAGFPAYVNQLHEMATRYGFRYGKHFFPPDIRVRELDRGISRIESLRRLGLVATAVGMGLRKEDMIESARMLLPRCWFDEQQTATGERSGFEGLKAYRKVQDSRTGEFRPQPVHDWSSHIADAFQILSLGLSRMSGEQPVLPTELESSDSPYDFAASSDRNTVYRRGQDLLNARRRQGGATSDNLPTSYGT